FKGPAPSTLLDELFETSFHENVIPERHRTCSCTCHAFFYLSFTPCQNRKERTYPTARRKRQRNGSVLPHRSSACAFRRLSSQRRGGTITGNGSYLHWERILP